MAIFHISLQWVYLKPHIRALSEVYSASSVLQFTKGFETMHAFSIMLKYIVLRDITRFLVMYVFVLLGFGFAFHALFQLSPTISNAVGSPFNTLLAATLTMGRTASIPE